MHFVRYALTRRGKRFPVPPIRMDLHWVCSDGSGSGSRRAKMTRKNLKKWRNFMFHQNPRSGFALNPTRIHYTASYRPVCLLYIYYFYNLDSTGNSYNFLMFVSYRYSKLFYIIYIYSNFSFFRRAACLKISPVWKALRWAVTLPISASQDSFC